ncbi:MAG: hypothetical protein ACOYL6_11130 [Bacteriovoracaceae bacterium]
MKFIFFFLLTLSVQAAESTFEVCKFEGEQAQFKPIAECTVYNGQISKRAHNLVVAMKACLGKNEKGDYLFNSMIEKQIWMKDRSIVEINLPLTFTSILNKDNGISTKVEELTHKRSKKESILIEVKKHVFLEGMEKKEINIDLKNKKIQSLVFKSERRNPFSPLPFINHHLSMGCNDLTEL